MRVSANHQFVIDKLYSSFKEKGFICEDEALTMMKAYNVSLIGVNRITDRLLSMGVIYQDKAAIDNVKAEKNEDGCTSNNDIDRAQIDYEALYDDVIKVEPVLQPLVDYVRNIRPPQPREWQQLVIQMNSANEYAFFRLFEMYFRMVIRIAMDFHKRKKIELADGIQEGCLGLLRGLEMYDRSRHESISSYLSLWIRQTIGRAVYEQNKTIRIPAHTDEMLSRFKRSQNLLLFKLGRKPTLQEIAEDMVVSIGVVESLFVIAKEVVSLTGMLENEQDDDFIFKYLALPSFAERLVNEYYSKDLCEKLLVLLTDRERLVLSLRYGLDNGGERTLEKIGLKLNVTRERIRQIEARAFKKIRYLKQELILQASLEN